MQAATHTQLYDYALQRMQIPLRFWPPDVQQRLVEVQDEMWHRITTPPIAHVLTNSLAEREDVRKSIHEIGFGGRIQPILNVRNWGLIHDIAELQDCAKTLEDWLHHFHDQYQRDSVPHDHSKVAWSLERIRNRIWELTAPSRLAATLAFHSRDVHPELIRQMIGPPR